MPSEQEVLSKINALENKLGIEKDFISQADVLSQINAMEQRIASTPMSIDQFVEKRRADSVKSTSEKASAFGTGLVEGVKGMAKEGGEALEEVPWYWATGVGALADYDTLGDILPQKKYSENISGIGRTLTTTKKFAQRCLKVMTLSIRN